MHIFKPKSAFPINNNGGVQAANYPPVVTPVPEETEFGSIDLYNDNKIKFNTLYNSIGTDTTDSRYISNLLTTTAIRQGDFNIYTGKFLNEAPLFTNYTLCQQKFSSVFLNSNIHWSFSRSISGGSTFNKVTDTANNIDYACVSTRNSQTIYLYNFNIITNPSLNLSNLLPQNIVNGLYIKVGDYNNESLYTNGIFYIAYNNSSWQIIDNNPNEEYSVIYTTILPNTPLLFSQWSLIDTPHNIPVAGSVLEQPNPDIQLLSTTLIAPPSGYTLDIPLYTLDTGFSGGMSLSVQNSSNTGKSTTPYHTYTISVVPGSSILYPFTAGSSPYRISGEDEPISSNSMRRGRNYGYDIRYRKSTHSNWSEPVVGGNVVSDTGLFYYLGVSLLFGTMSQPDPEQRIYGDYIVFIANNFSNNTIYNMQIRYRIIEEYNPNTGEFIALENPILGDWIDLPDFYTESQLNFTITGNGRLVGDKISTGPLTPIQDRKVLLYTSFKKYNKDEIVLKIRDTSGLLPFSKKNRSLIETSSGDALPEHVDADFASISVGFHTNALTIGLSFNGFVSTDMDDFFAYETEGPTSVNPDLPDENNIITYEYLTAVDKQKTDFWYAGYLSSYGASVAHIDYTSSPSLGYINTFYNLFSPKEGDFTNFLNGVMCPGATFGGPGQFVNDAEDSHWGGGYAFATNNYSTINSILPPVSYASTNNFVTYPITKFDSFNNTIGWNSGYIIKTNTIFRFHVDAPSTTSNAIKTRFKIEKNIPLQTATIIESVDESLNMKRMFLPFDRCNIYLARMPINILGVNAASH